VRVANLRWLLDGQVIISSDGTLTHSARFSESNPDRMEEKRVRNARCRVAQDSRARRITQMTRTPLRDQHARIPSNRTAALVTSRGVHYEYAPTDDSVLSSTPIATRHFHGKGKNFTGVKIGRLVIIGFYGIHSLVKRSRGAESRLWVARCACGMYIKVKEKTISKHVERPDSDICCHRCHHIKDLRKR